MTKKTDSNDPKYHYEIWSGPSETFGAKSLYYVENHNIQSNYKDLTIDFGDTAELIINEYQRTGLGNWVAPLAHVSRHLIELHLKALMETIKQRDFAFDDKAINGHNLEAIWLPCRTWLIEHGYELEKDARIDLAQSLISAFHAIDPSGDLFRFGISYKTAFGKQKSCDRVGIILDLFENELMAARGLLDHWEATLYRELLKEEMGWSEDPFFDPANFPRKS